MLQEINVKETNGNRLEKFTNRERISMATITKQLGPRFAERAARADEGDLFVAENFVELKAHGLVAAGVPKELGGGGASHADLADVLRHLGHYCGSTALAFSMHTHQVATAAWRWRHQSAPVDGLLERVAAENIVILEQRRLRLAPRLRHSHASRWWVSDQRSKNLRQRRSSGRFTHDQRGLRRSSSGAVGAALRGFHESRGSQDLDTWKVMGMRGTGSHDIQLTDVFIPDSGISLQRPQGKWHPLFHIISMIAIPLIYSVYVGIAEAARDLAVKQAAKRRPDGYVAYLLGGLENELTSARLALQDMIAAAAANEPGFGTTNRVMIGRTLVARGVLKSVELAMEAAGGGAFYPSGGLERLFRDAQACRYHPLQEGAQRAFAGRLALGQDVEAAG